MTIEHEPDVSKSMQTSRRSLLMNAGGLSTGLPLLHANPTDEQHWIGKLMSGRYRIEYLLAAGTWATVYCAMDLIRQERCAIKLLRRSALSPEQIQQRSRREREAARRLFHPNIVSIYEYGENEAGAPFLVMELLEGRTLQSLLQEVGVLAFPRALEILRDVGGALEYMHSQGLVHLSPQPEHIFLLPSAGELGQRRDGVKLMSFSQTQIIGTQGGAGKFISAAQSREVMSAYLAPELTLPRDSSYDARADQWALAVLAYRLFSGREPFVHTDPHKLGWLIRQEEPTPLHQLVPGLPAHVCHAVQMALTKRKEHRFDRVCDFIRALDHRSLLADPKSIPVVSERSTAPEGRQVLQTVQCLRTDLIAMTKDADATAVPELLETEIPTERYSNLILSEALRLSSEECQGKESSEQQMSAAHGRSSTRPSPGSTPSGVDEGQRQTGQLVQQVVEAPPAALPAARERLVPASHWPMPWLVAAFSFVLALGTLVFIARSIVAKLHESKIVSVRSGSASPQGSARPAAHPELTSASTASTGMTQTHVQPSEPVLGAVQPQPPAVQSEQQAPSAIPANPSEDNCAAAVAPPPQPHPESPPVHRGSTKPWGRRPGAELAALPSSSAPEKALREPLPIKNAPADAELPEVLPAPASSASDSRIQLVD